MSPVPETSRSTAIDLDLVKQIKEVERKRIKVYVERKPSAEYHEGCRGIWTIPCDLAFPCATQNEINLESAKALIANGCKAVCEGSNMPTTPDGIDAILEAGLMYTPSKASNAGGVAVSALEMSQNSMRFYWTLKLKGIMSDLYKNVAAAAAEYGHPGNLMVGANIAGFLKVADSMLAYGLV